MSTARSRACRTADEARAAAREIGFPVMLRGGFALGGKGSGIVETRGRPRRRRSAAPSPAACPQVLVEESLRGWKEIEYEVVRDGRDNCIAVCNMENLDPMGIHTGESIVVAPSQTLNDEEYQLLRSVAIKTIRHLGIVGECNIQYALNPRGTDYRVIEVNARLSRSSALASKATGYPLAYVAAKIALGYSLPEIPNAITRRTTAFFEPALDYLVCKVPRWDLAKFRGASMRIGTEMKSVGEVMAIGRTFPEVIQKALRMLDIGVEGLDPEAFEFDELEDSLSQRYAAAHLRRGPGAAARDDAWSASTSSRESTPGSSTPSSQSSGCTASCSRSRRHLDETTLREAKELGLRRPQDRASSLRHQREASATERKRLGIAPHLAQIDTLAAEFPAETNYLYSSYHARATDTAPSWRKKVHGAGFGRLPHRLERGVRLVLRQRRQGGARARVRDHDGQLQPRDGEHRLRRVRQAHLRRGELRDSAGDLRARAALRRRGVDGRAGAQQPGDPPAPRRRAHPRHQRREHRYGRGPAQVQRPARPAGNRPAALGARHRRVRCRARLWSGWAATRCWCARATCSPARP